MSLEDNYRIITDDDNFILQVKDEVTRDDLALRMVRIVRKELALPYDALLFITLGQLALLNCLEIHESSELAMSLHKLRGHIFAEFKRLDEVKRKLQTGTAGGQWFDFWLDVWVSKGLPCEDDDLSYAILIMTAISKWVIVLMPNKENFVNFIGDLGAHFEEELERLPQLKRKRHEMLVN